MTMRDVTTVEMVIAAALALIFMVRYAARSNWRHTAMGRHLFAFMGVLAAILTMWVVSRFVGRLPTWVWAVALAGFDVVMGWRVLMLLITQRKPAITTPAAPPSGDEER